MNSLNNTRQSLKNKRVLWRSFGINSWKYCHIKLSDLRDKIPEGMGHLKPGP